MTLLISQVEPDAVYELNVTPERCFNNNYLDKTNSKSDSLSIIQS